MSFRCPSPTKILTEEVFDKSNGFSHLHYASSIGKALMETLDEFMNDAQLPEPRRLGCSKTLLTKLKRCPGTDGTLTSSTRSLISKITLLRDLGDWNFNSNKMVYVMNLTNVYILMRKIIGRAGEYLEEFAPRLTIFAKEEPEAQVETPPAAAGKKRKGVETAPILLLEVRRRKA
ncbi:hypothetical protein RUND412_001788 [Rhizina undulata]